MLVTWRPENLSSRSVRGILLATSMLALGGCVSATSELSAISNDSQAARLEAQEKKAAETEPGAAAAFDPNAAAAANQQVAMNVPAEGRLLPVANDPANGQDALPVPVVMPSTGIAATKGSIYAVQSPAAVNPAAIQVQGQVAAAEISGLDGSSGLPSMVPVPVLNPLKSSLFKADLPPQATVQAAIATEPAPDADQVTGAFPGAEAAKLPLTKAAAEDQAGPAAGTEEAAMTTGNSEPLDGKALDAADLQPMPSMQELQQKKPQEKKKFSLSDLFKRKKTTQNFDPNRFGARKDPAVRVAAMPNMDTGKVMGDALPGVNANAMFPVIEMSDDEHAEDESAGLMKLASLPSMMRMGPNGLLMQTDKVEARCLRPQLVRMLKHIEAHYQRPVIVTSGFRDSGHNRRVGGARGSLHTLCAAADIQIEGVTKWQLAEYLRTIPGRGGVGTYCHTDSVHIDVGEERDWNWRCRRKKRRNS